MSGILHTHTTWLALLALAALCGGVACWLRSRRLARSLAERTLAYQQALREHASLHQDLIERAGDGIVIVQDGRVVMANRRVLEFSGHERVEVLGRPFSAFIPQDELERVGEYYSLRMRGEKAPVVYETKLLHRDGSVLDVEISGGLIPLRGANADLVLIRDITERKRHEASLLGYSKQLEQANHRLEFAIARSNELACKAESANRAKTDFLSSMSHELRTPLTTIMGMTELLKDGALGPLDARIREGLATIDASSQHLLDLINDILDIAKLESGRVELERRPVDIRALCNTCVAFVQETANRKGVSLSLECAAAPQKFWADGRRLRQILINLLGNAVKFTPEGGSAGLLVASLEGGQGVRFTVWDTGIGIPQDKIARLFQPFEQLDDAARQRPSGTGLGLSLVRRLVVLHGGTIEVKSDQGQGSHFVVSIPDPVARIGLNGQAPLPPAESLAGVRVVLAEDDPTNAEIIRMQLERRGCRVHCVQDGAQALEAVRTEKPDIVLMDIQMPIIDGLEATRRLKAEQALRSIPVICLTALASEADRRSGMEAGADEYQSKPVDMNSLIAKMRHLIDLHPPVGVL